MNDDDGYDFDGEDDFDGDKWMLLWFCRYFPTSDIEEDIRKLIAEQ